MESISVGDLKARFSEILERVKKGEEIIISFGKKRERVAVLLPYNLYVPKQARTLGPLKNRGKCIIHKDFKMTDEELLTS